MMKYNNLKGSLILILAALIWGLAFVAQSGAAELVPPFAFNALRSYIGALALFAFYKLLNIKNKAPFFPVKREERKSHLIAGLVCGLFLAVSVNFQQFGIAFYPESAATEARAGFITALYVIIVPLISVFIGKKLHGLVWAGVAIAVLGVYFLCFSSGIGGVYFADFLVLLCAISFSLHIMSVDKYVSLTGGVKLSIMQFAVCGTVSLVLSLIFENRSIAIENIISAAPQILYLGIMSSGIAYTLQIVGQKFAEPAVASISMSLESVFAALGGWLISGNSLSLKEIFGCVLVFVAITVAQLPEASKKGKANN